MAGEYYRWLARNEKPIERKELTPAEKRRNWWDYHKWHVIIALVCAIFVGDLIYDMVSNARNKPDYMVAYVGQTALPDGVVEAVEAGLADLGRDVNGNGKVQVELLQYVLSEESTENPILTENSAERNYAASLLLQTNIEMVESMIFLMEEPEMFQAAYPIFRETEPMYIHWGDCPALTALELGQFEIPLVGTTAVGDCQKAMENIAVGLRGLWNGERNDAITAGIELFEIMTEGAA